MASSSRPRTQPDSHRREIGRAHDVSVAGCPTCADTIGFAGDLRDTDAVEASAEWHEARRRDISNSRHLLEASRHLPVEERALEAVVSREWQDERHGEQMVAMNPGLHAQHTREALDHECARRQQHDGERQLRDGKRGAKRAASPRDARAGLSQRRLWIARRHAQAPEVGRTPPP